MQNIENGMKVKEYQSAFLNKRNSVCIKGIAAICIMLGHYLANYPWYIGGWFHGFLWVGIFFFYSGYGLRISVDSKPLYLDGFWKHKFMNVLLPYMLAAGAATLFCYIKGDVPVHKLLLGPIMGFQYNMVLWYVVELFGIYIIFYFVQKFKPQLLNITMCISYIVLLFLGVVFDIGTWWYTATSAFLLGLMFWHINNLIDILKRRRIPLTVIFILLYAIIMLTEAKIIIFPWKPTYVITAIQMIIIPLFVLMFEFWCVDFKGRGVKFFSILGKCSYDIYLWHMVILWINQDLFKESTIGCIVSVAETLLWAEILYFGKQKMKCWIGKQHSVSR